MRKKQPGIYQIKNNLDNKCYVGSSIDIPNRWKRWRHYFKNDNLPYPSHLVRAVRLHGLEHFTFTILEECEPTKEMLEARENHYIETLKPEYNSLQKAYSGIGNKSRIGQKQSDEEKENHRQAALKIMSNPEVRQKISDTMKGTKPINLDALLSRERTDEERQKLSNSLKTSEKHKAYTDSKKGKANVASSISGEYGVNWRENTQKWMVKINNKFYGAYDTIDEAKLRRDGILAIPEEQRKPNPTGSPNKSSGEYGIFWNTQKQKWSVKIKNKYHGSFQTLNDAIEKRNQSF